MRPTFEVAGVGGAATGPGGAPSIFRRQRSMYERCDTLKRKIGYVRLGSLADKVTSPRHVRFTPNNGRWTAHPSQHFGYAFMSTRPRADALLKQTFQCSKDGSASPCHISHRDSGLSSSSSPYEPKARMHEKESDFVWLTPDGSALPTILALGR